MNILDRIAKKLGYYRRDTAGFVAAQANRLTNDWTTSTLSSDGMLSSGLKTLRARSRQLCDNNEYASKFLGMIKSGLVGDQGINLRMKIRRRDRKVGERLVKGDLDIRTNKLIEEAWSKWCAAENCTVTGQLTWRDVQNICVETIARDGEVLIRLIRGWDNPFGFAIQIMESDYLDIDKQEQLSQTNRIRMGVELDEWRRPLAYWILKKNPNDNWYYATTTTARWERVPSSDIVHAFLHHRPEQTRGWPWMSSAMSSINMLGGFQEAHIIGARVAAAKCGFMEVDGDVKYTGENDGSGNRIMEASPGSFEVLPIGMKLASWNPDFPKTNYGEFVNDVLRGASAGMGVSYNSLANDFESVNFSSARYATGEEREFFKNLQQWFIDHVCRPVFESWLEAALFTGALKDLRLLNFERLNVPQWKPRRWSYINPVDEVRAYVEAVNNGLTSRTRVLAEMNVDVEDVADELADEAELFESLGLVVPYQPQPQEPPAEESAQDEPDEEAEPEDQEEEEPAPVNGNGRSRLL